MAMKIQVEDIDSNILLVESSVILTSCKNKR